MKLRLLVLTAACCFALIFAAGASAQVKHWGSYAGSDIVSEPTEIPNLENVVEVDAGNQSSYALESNGTVWAFGQGKRGELGNGLTEASLTEAEQVVFPPGVTITSIGEAQDAAYAVDSTGQGWSWGLTSPALCLGKAPGQTLEPQPVPNMTSAVAVQGAAKHVLWLMANGNVETCGTNQNGQLGVTERIESAAHPIVVPGVSNVTQISAGQKESCALTASGAVYDWGSDLNGQIGDGEEQPGVFSAFRVPLAGPASDVSCGGDLPENGHAMAIVGGNIYGWGADQTGQLGDGHRGNRTTPTLASAVNSLGVVEVIASGAYSLGLTATGNVYAWGSNLYHALGVGPTRMSYSLSPVLVDSEVSEISGTAYNSVDR